MLTFLLTNAQDVFEIIKESGVFRRGKMRRKIYCHREKANNFNKLEKACDSK